MSFGNCLRSCFVGQVYWRCGNSFQTWWRWLLLCFQLETFWGPILCYCWPLHFDCRGKTLIVIQVRGGKIDFRVTPLSHGEFLWKPVFRPPIWRRCIESNFVWFWFVCQIVIGDSHETPCGSLIFCWVQFQTLWNLLEFIQKNAAFPPGSSERPLKRPRWIGCVNSTCFFSTFWIHKCPVFRCRFFKACWQRLCGQCRKLGMGTGSLVSSAFALNFRWTFASVLGNL